MQRLESKATGMGNQGLEDGPAQPVLVRKLAAVRRDDAPEVGTKAANLGELIAAGFAVPEGIVLCAAAYEAVDNPTEIAALPPDVVEAIDRALGLLADVPVAVRSSAVGEDLMEASFAGQYDTVLDVCGIDAIAEAVCRCWSSASSDRVREYRRQRGMEASPMAVIIQRLIPADAAGVAFSANPISGARDECMVGAVRGLGERLVSGAATPDEWIVRGDEVEATTTPEQAVSERQVRAVAALVRTAAEHFGRPQDIEWAIAGDALFILQSRPITALPPAPVAPVPIAVDPPPGSWEHDPNHFPLPPSPLFASFLLGTDDRMRPVVESFGLLFDGIETAIIGGHAYQRMRPLGGVDREPPPAWLAAILMPVMRRVVPSLRKRIAAGVEAGRSDAFYQALERWREVDRPAVAARNAELRDVDLAALSDAELSAHLEVVIEHCAELLGCMHPRVAFSVAVVAGEFALLATDVLGWDDNKMFDLFAGLSEMSTEPGRSIARLAARAADRPELVAILESADRGDVAGRLAAVDRELAAGFAEHLREHGCRALRIDIIDPNIDERPELVARLIADQIRRGFDPRAVAADGEARRRKLLDEAREALADRPDQLAELERLYARAVRAYPEREDNEAFLVSTPLALFRRIALECGERLAVSGVFDRRDDVFFLRIDELSAALRDGGDRRALVARRRGEREWAKQTTPPARFGPPAPDGPPPLDWLPPEVRGPMRAITWAFDRLVANQASSRRQDGVGGIDGLASAPGSYEGPVRVVAGEHEFHKIEPGDVLVCKATSPVWSVLFANLGGLITDTGGSMSHQAIIAREYRIPAVTGTGNATALLRDGQRVRVDGDAGRVEILGGGGDASVEPIPVEITPPPGSWEREANHFPEPISPLLRVFFERLNPLLRDGMIRFGFLFDGVEFAVVGDYVYHRLRPMGGKEVKPPPDWLIPWIMPALRRLVPSLRARIARGVEVVRNDELAAILDAWWETVRAERIAGNRALQAVDRQALSDREAVEHLERALDQLVSGLDAHIPLGTAISVILGDFALWMQRNLDWNNADILGLFTGTSEMSVAPVAAIAEIAELAAGRPATMAVLESAGADLEARLAEVDPETAAAVADYQREFGCRAMSFDPIQPSLDERPELLASLIVDQARAGRDGDHVAEASRRRRDQLVARARAELADRVDDLATFEDLLARASSTYPVREDNQFFNAFVPGALVRKAALECGRRLAAAGVVDAADDVFFLELDEVAAAMSDRHSRAALVHRRKGERAWALSNEPPPSFGPPIPKEPPPMGWMPAEVRTMMESMMWFMERLVEPVASSREQDGAGGIDGLAAAPGTYEGTARVVSGELEFDKIQPGDVLVCRATSPVWSVLFARIGALVTDTGGIMSHQAIIAREYRIPAVTGTGNVTRLLRDGQRVRVDGDAGRVAVIA